MSVLRVMAFIPTLEQNSRLVGKSRSNEEERFRESLAKLLSSQGVEAVKVYEDVSNTCPFHGNVTDNVPSGRHGQTMQPEQRRRNCGTKHYPS